MAIMYSTKNNLSNPNQVIDGVLSPSYKWFAFQFNALDGSFHLMDDTLVAETGWWSNTLSDASGNFAIEEEITVTFATPQSITAVRVVGDNLLGNYPVDFRVSVVGTNGSYSETITGNTSNSRIIHFDRTYDANAISLDVSKISVGNQQIKILEFDYPFEFIRQLSYTITANTSAEALPLVSSDDTESIDATFDTSLVRVVDNVYNLEQVVIVDVDNTFSTDCTVPLHAVVTTTLQNNFITSLEYNISASFDTEITVYMDIDITYALRAYMLGNMHNVHTICDAPQRQILGKVEVTYSDPLIDADTSYTSNSINKVSNVASLADGALSPTYKWFSFHDNALDGSYHVMPIGNEAEVGWWGNTLSNADGTFSTPQIITMISTPKPVWYVEVYGDDLLNVYPVAFTIKLYSNTTLLQTITESNNQSVHWKYTLSTALQNVTSIQLSVTKLNKQSTVKVLEFYTSIVETYYSDMVASIHLFEELDYIEQGISLGAISSNETDITLYNDGRFDFYNNPSSLRPYLKRNRKVKPYLGVIIKDELIDWYPLGTFWTTAWELPDTGLLVNITARDRLELLRTTDFKSSIVYYNTSLYDLFLIILNDAGVRRYNVSEALNGIVVPVAWWSKMSHRSALERLASMCMVQLYMDRDDTLYIQPFKPLSTVSKEFNNDNVYERVYPSMWIDLTNYVEVTAYSYKQSAAELFDVNYNTVIGPQRTMTFEIESQAVPIVDAIISLDADTGLVIKSKDVYAWGTIITVENKTGFNKTLRRIYASGNTLTNTGNTICAASNDAAISDMGVIKTSINHELIQDVTYANTLAANLLNGYGTSKYDVQLDCRGDIGVYLQDTIVDTPAESVYKLYQIKRQTIDWDGALRSKIEGKSF